MIYLTAIFLPPLYFFIKGRWVSGIIHSVLWLIAVALCLSLLGAVVGFPLYFVSSICAVWDLRKRMVEEQATLMANKMAEAMRQQPPRLP